MLPVEGWLLDAAAPVVSKRGLVLTGCCRAHRHQSALSCGYWLLGGMMPGLGLPWAHAREATDQTTARATPGITVLGAKRRTLIAGPSLHQGSDQGRILERLEVRHDARPGSSSPQQDDGGEDTLQCDVLQTFADQ